MTQTKNLPSLSADRLRDRWTAPGDFYRERDNRTELEVDDLFRYVSRRVAIHIDPTEADKSTVQRISLLACNLTARWARHVRVYIAEDVPLSDELRRGQFQFLDQRLKHEMRLADPFGDFKFMPSVSSGDEMKLDPPLRLFIGSWRRAQGESARISDEDFVINAAGWNAAGRRGRYEADSDSSIRGGTLPAAGLAASIGVADLFKRAINHDREDWIPDFSWNLGSEGWANGRCPGDGDLSSDQSLDLGKTLLAGVGAIGSALVYLLDMATLRGELTLLDRDRVETSNLNRSPLFTVCHALSAELKTDATARYLDHQKELRTETIDGTWHESVSQIRRNPYDVWISLTNEDGAWAEIPFQLPPIVLQGTTTSGWGFGAGRHIPRREDCTLCRLPRPETEFRGPCAEGDIQTEPAQPPARASLPFLSAASASLVLAELMKLESAEAVDSPNEISADLKIGLPGVTTLHRLADPSCRGCRALESQLWIQRGGRGRYRDYSVKV